MILLGLWTFCWILIFILQIWNFKILWLITIVQSRNKNNTLYQVWGLQRANWCEDVILSCPSDDIQLCVSNYKNIGNHTEAPYTESRCGNRFLNLMYCLSLPMTTSCCDSSRRTNALVSIWKIVFWKTDDTKNKIFQGLVHNFVASGI